MNPTRLVDRLTNALSAALGRGRAGPHTTAVRGRVTVTTYDMELVRALVPEWDELTRPERIDALDEWVPHATRSTTTNVTLTTLHEYIVDELDPNQTATDLSASHLALGTDDTEPSAADTGLGSEQYREGVDSSTDSSNDLETTTLLDEGDGNGNTYQELGLVTAASGGTFLNHALISDTPKTDDVTATFEVVLQFRPA